eukprot:7310395-Lingulodinium_polyedra.AAC.1
MPLGNAAGRVVLGRAMGGHPLHCHAAREDYGPDLRPQVGVLPLRVVCAVAEPHHTVTDILTVGVDDQLASNGPHGGQGGVELAPLGGLLPPHRPRPRAARLGHHDRPGGPRHQRVQGLHAGPVRVDLAAAAGRERRERRQRREVWPDPLRHLRQRHQRRVGWAEAGAGLPVRQTPSQGPEVKVRHGHAADLVPPRALPEPVLR